jgi:hypothetical protein
LHRSAALLQDYSKNVTYHTVGSAHVAAQPGDFGAIAEHNRVAPRGNSPRGSQHPVDRLTCNPQFTSDVRLRKALTDQAFDQTPAFGSKPLRQSSVLNGLRPDRPKTVKLPLVRRSALLSWHDHMS